MEHEKFEHENVNLKPQVETSQGEELTTPHEQITTHFQDRLDKCSLPPLDPAAYKDLFDKVYDFGLSLAERRRYDQQVAVLARDLIERGVCEHIGGVNQDDDIEYIDIFQTSIIFGAETLYIIQAGGVDGKVYDEWSSVVLSKFPLTQENWHLELESYSPKRGFISLKSAWKKDLPFHPALQDALCKYV